jgi:cellobiose-specific phosphotransferase system component IIC
LPPRWWWYSPIPWPRSILTALVFSVLGALFAWLCVRAGIRGRLVLFGMCLALALMWAWSAVDNIGFFEQFGASYGLEFTRIGAPVRMSGTAGSVFGVLLALLLLSRRKRVATADPTT